MSSSIPVDTCDSGESAAQAGARRRRRWPFNRFAAIAAALILAIGATDAFVIRMQRDASIAAYETAMTNLSRVVSGQTAYALAAVDSLMTEVAVQVADRAWREDFGAHASAILANLGKPPSDLESLAVIDAAGRVVAATPDGPAPGADLSASEVYKSLRGGGTAPILAAPVENGLVLARRLSGSNGQFAGAVVATISSASLQEFFGRIVPPTRKVTLISDGGAVLMQYPAGMAAPAGEAARARRLVFPDGACVAYFGPDIVGDAPVAGSICRSEALPIAVETTASGAEVLAFWEQERIGCVAGGVLASLVALWLLQIFARQMRRLEISERSLAAEKQAVEAAHKQLDVALSNIAQGVTFFDGAHRLIVANRRFCELYDLPEDCARPGATLAQIADAICRHDGPKGLDGASFLASLQDIANARTPNASVWELESGRMLAIQRRPLPDGGWVATLEDITDRRRAEDKISYLAQHDALTGLVNRSVLNERISQVAEAASRDGRFAVLFVDLDRFKAVNDTLGHDVGDALLKEVASRLKELVRTRGTIARFGGDEFVILLTGISGPDEVGEWARKLIAVVSAPYKIQQHEVLIGASVGIELSKGEPDSVDALVKHADMALYMAKAQGRGVYRFFEPDMDSQTRDRHRLEAALRNALAERQFELAYQPIFDTRSGEVCAFEALLRWNQPERGPTPPDEFMTVAEQCGLIIPIGEFAIQQACWQAAQWPGDIRVTLNLSPVQFRAVSLVPAIAEALTATGLAPNRLELEITEAVLTQANARNLSTLQRLRDLGVMLVLDDFGVGYASMSRLRQFPFDKIKIERGFIRDLTATPEAVHFVRAIVSLCRNLNIRTTAKGVETEAQAALLIAEGCTEIQGFFSGRPGPAASVPLALAQRGVAAELLGTPRSAA
jgi:diguanylate cyclase (GGDEF)-like protein